MKKVFKTIKTIILAILFILYAAVIIGMSTLVLNRNDYGYTRFGENDILIITKENATKEYKEGSIVITQLKLIDELKEGDKIFLYKANEEKQEVKLVYTEIKEVVNNPSTKYIKINDGTAWGEEYIAGQAIKVIDKLGFVIGALQTKWLFFGLLIVPVFFILLIEIYQFIITIKYDEDEDEIEEKEEKKPVEEEPKSTVETKPVEEEKPTTEEKPVEEQKPITEEKTVEEPKPTVETKPVEESKPEEKIQEVTTVVEKEVTITVQEDNDEEIL